MPYPLKNYFYPKSMFEEQFGNGDVKIFSKIIMEMMKDFLENDDGVELDISKFGKDKNGQNLVKKGLYDDGFSKNYEKIRENYTFMVDNNVSV